MAVFTKGLGVVKENWAMTVEQLRAGQVNDSENNTRVKSSPWKLLAKLKTRREVDAALNVYFTSRAYYCLPRGAGKPFEIVPPTSLIRVRLIDGAYIMEERA